MKYTISILYIFLAFLFSDGKWNFQADGELLEYQDNGVTINKLTQNVQVFNDSLYLKTDEAYNYKEIKKLHLYGNTQMISNTDTLLCDSMIYWMDKDSLFAYGGVTLKQIDSKLNSQTLNFWKTGGYRKSSFIANIDVSIINKDKKITADNISYNDETEKMILFKNANVISNNRNLSGDNINIQFNDSLITFINVTGDAEAHNILYAKIDKNSNTEKKFIDIMMGNDINVAFENDKIKTIELDRMGSTMYHVIDSSLLIGVNNVTGDLINLNFENDVLKKINVKGDARGNFTPELGNSNIDSSIIYQSEEIDYFIDKQKSYLYNEGEIKYQDMLLESNYIHVDWKKNILDAIKESDKLPSVTTAGGDPMEGDSLKYDLIAKRGTIYKGKTKVNDAYYHGNKIYRNEPNLYHVTSSQYTSCDLDHPHYSFYSSNMKMIPGDRIIARPLILKIFDFPIIGIPFAVLPNKGGSRHSGWIMPSFGFDNTNGSTMNGLGYYWAPNDYMDSRLLINFSDRIGLWLRNTINYKLRYKIDGKIDVKFVRKLKDTKYIESIITDSTTQQYEINIKHNHKISPTQALNINFNYVSNYDFHQNTNSDPLANIDKQLSKSSLVYSKSWSEWGNSMSFNISDITDLQKQKTIDLIPDGDGEMIFPIVRNNYPNISFYHSTSNFFGDGDKWYQALKWSMSTSHNGYYKKGAYSYINSNNEFQWKDTTDYRNGVTTNMEFAYPKKIFNWLNMATRMNLREDWIFKYKDYISDGDELTMETKDGFKRRLYTSLSATFNTKIYGIFSINIAQIEAMRHTITPTFSLSYIPNITKPIMGYDLNTFFTNVGEFEYSSDGNLLDPFYGSAVSPTSEREQLIYKLRIQNLFQIKTNKSGEIEKNNVLDWNIQTGYDAFAKELNWSPIKSDLQLSIPGIAKQIDIDFTHDIYKFEDDTGKRIGEYKNILYGIPVPYLTKLNIRTQISLSGNRLLGFESDSLYDMQPLTSESKLWTTNIGLTYKKEQKLNYTEQTMGWDENFQLNTTTTLNISTKWKLSYRVAFDLIEQTMGGQAFTFTRNLHCWEFSFRWIPSRSYFLHIYVKQPELRDIKLESRSKRDRNNFF